VALRMFLIDTDVLSALRKRERHPEILGWLAGQRPSDLYLSVVSVGEMERGLSGVKGRDAGFAGQLEEWLDALLRLYGNRILPVDLAVARRWGRLSHDIGNTGPDLLIAATALEHGLTVVTCNCRHFRSTGVPVLDPSRPAKRRSTPQHKGVETVPRSLGGQ